MITDFPTHTIILTLILSITLSIIASFILFRSLIQVQLPIKRRWQLSIAIVPIIWLLIRLLTINPPGNVVVPPEVNIMFFLLGLAAGIVLLMISRVFREAVRAIPTNWLIGLHILRFGFGSLGFLVLLDMKLLPPQFALPAGYGDVTVALLASGLIYLIARRKTYPRHLVIGWNILGLLDFVIALIVGGISLGPFAAQIVASGNSPVYLNYVFIIPTYVVPLYTLLHIYLLFQIVSTTIAIEK